MTTTKDSHDGLPPPAYNDAVPNYRSNRPATITTTTDSHDGLSPPAHNDAVPDYRSNRPAAITTTTDSHDGLPPPAYSETDPSHDRDIPIVVFLHVHKFAYLPSYATTSDISLLGPLLKSRTYAYNIPEYCSFADFTSSAREFGERLDMPLALEVYFINKQGRKGGPVNERNWPAAKNLLKQQKGSLRMMVAPLKRELGVRERMGAMVRELGREVVERLNDVG